MVLLELACFFVRKCCPNYRSHEEVGLDLLFELQLNQKVGKPKHDLEVKLKFKK
jgi:hypothetical protein